MDKKLRRKFVVFVATRNKWMEAACAATAKNAGITPRNVLNCARHSRKDFIQVEEVVAVAVEEATMMSTLPQKRSNNIIPL